MDKEMSTLADRYLKGEFTLEEAGGLLSWLLTEDGQGYLTSYLEENACFRGESIFYMASEKAPSAKMLRNILENATFENIEI